MTDLLTGDAYALARACKRDPEGFSEILNRTDCLEHHKLIIRLCAIVELAVRAHDWDDLTVLVGELGGAARQRASRIGQPTGGGTCPENRLPLGACGFDSHPIRSTVSGGSNATR